MGHVGDRAASRCRSVNENWQLQRQLHHPVVPMRMPPIVCAPSSADVAAKRHCDGGLPTGMRYSGSSSLSIPSLRLTEPSSKAPMTTVPSPRAVACR